MAVPERIRRAAEDVKKAVFRIAGARYVLPENRYLALELLGAGITSLRVAYEASGLPEIDQRRKEAGAIYSQLEEMLFAELEGRPFTDAREIRHKLDGLLDRLMTLYKYLVK